MAIPVTRFRALERPRLFPGGDPERPAHAEALPPLTLLHAPAGMGKTVLAAQWVRSAAFADIDVRWVRASADPSTGTAGSGFWLDLLEALKGAGAQAHARQRSSARTAVERAVASLDRRTMLVIDDYQEATGAQLDLHVAGLLEFSDLLHLTVVSRRFEVLDGPLVTSQTTACVLSQHDLAFTLPETQQLADLYGLRRPDLVAQLHESSGGWPVAVRLVLQQLVDGTGERDLSSMLSRFVLQHIDGLDEPRRRVLMAAALCDGISSELLVELVDGSEQERAAVVRDICELGLAQQQWYPETIRLSCHPGFVSTLRTRAEQEFGAEPARRLRFRHALDLGRDEPVRAVGLLLDLEEYDQASRTAARRFLDVIGSGAVVLPRLRQIDLQVLRQHAILLGGRLLLEQMDPNGSGEVIGQLHRALRESSRGSLLRSDAELLVPTISMLMVAERMRGNEAESLRLARDLEQRLASASTPVKTTLRRSLSIIHSVSALTGVMGGDLGLASREFTEALRVAESLLDLHEQQRAWNGLAITAALAGEIELARGYLDRERRLRERTGVESPHLSWVNGSVARCLIAVEDGDSAALDAALAEVAQVRGRVEQWPMIATMEAVRARLSEGNQAAKRLIRERAESIGATFPVSVFMRGVLVSYDANLATLSGDHRRAAEELDQISQQHPYAGAARARLRLFSEDDLGAVELVEPLLARSRPRIRAEAAGIAAVAHWRLGQRERAFAALGTVLEAATESGLRAHLAMLPYDPLLELLDAAAEAEPGAVGPGSAGPGAEGSGVAGAESEAGAGLSALRDRMRAIPEELRSRILEPLTRAELRTLEGVAAWRTIAEAAERLFITQNTVKFHLRSIYRKLRVSGRDDAVAQARRMGLIEPPQ